MSEPPDPGWYPDPGGSDELRWWDGRAWTDHTSGPYGRADAEQESEPVWDLEPGPTRDAGPGPAPSPGGALPYASFGHRAAALLLDVAVIFAILVVLTMVLGIVVGIFLADADGNVTDAQSTALGFVLLTFLFFVPVLYSMAFEGGRYGQGIGKWAMQISIRQPDGTGPVTRTQVLRRTVSKGLFSGIFFGAGYFVMFLDPQRRTLHDRIGEDVVIHVAGRVPFGALLRSAFRKA